VNIPSISKQVVFWLLLSFKYSNYANTLRTTITTNYARGNRKAEDGCERRVKGLFRPKKANVGRRLVEII
jgi:hypothetical protein